jgi:hypothetical protein
MQAVESGAPGALGVAPTKGASLQQGLLADLNAVAFVPLPMSRGVA